jgi:hypothetical protein
MSKAIIEIQEYINRMIVSDPLFTIGWNYKETT